MVFVSILVYNFVLSVATGCKMEHKARDFLGLQQTFGGVHVLKDSYLTFHFYSHFYFYLYTYTHTHTQGGKEKTKPGSMDMNIWCISLYRCDSDLTN